MARMDFTKEVIKRSYELPVVVDFWAPWCGPCQMLGPTIEGLSREQEGRWTLVKVNVDEHQDLAREYGVKGIPDVKLFHKGKAVGEFAGALSKGQIEAWLDEHIPDDRLGALEGILSRLEKKDPTALAELKLFVQNNPDVLEARLALAREVVFSDANRALELVEPFVLGDKHYDDADDIRTLARFTMEQPDDSPAGKALKAARVAAEAGDQKALVEYIIQATTADKTYADDLPRKTGIALFRQWGTDHPLTKEFRWKFDMVLY